MKKSFFLSHQFLDSREWLWVRRRALERADYRCESPGCTEREFLEVNHVRPRKYYPELSLDLGNLEVLCARHHAEIHPWIVCRSKYSNVRAANDDQFELPLESSA
jgi:hypothetical protein